MLSQFTSEGGHACLADLNFDFPKSVYPVGRLDHDSEGLLILTDDNLLKNKLLEPRQKMPKTYLAQVEGQVEPEHLKKLENGLEIKHKGKVHFTQRAVAKRYSGAIPEERDPPVRFRKTVPTDWLTLTISEGKNRQVRKMTAAVGLPTLRLIRLQIGQLALANMAIGEVRELKKEEIYRLTIGQ